MVVIIGKVWLKFGGVETRLNFEGGWEVKLVVARVGKRFPLGAD